MTTTVKDPSELPRDALEKLVRELQIILWLDEAHTDNGKMEYWNPDKEWDCEILDTIGILLHEAGLGLKGDNW